MAGIFGKIFVGIYVEIKRSDGTWLTPHIHHVYGHGGGRAAAPPTGGGGGGSR